MTTPTYLPFLTLAASINQDDPWEISHRAGAVRMMPSIESTKDRPVSPPETNVQLKLIDLGFFNVGGCEQLANLAMPPGKGRSEIVLLLPRSLSPTIANLYEQPAATTFEQSNHLARQQWFPTWRRFIDCDEGLPSDLFGELADQSSSMSAPSSPLGVRRYVFGVTSNTTLGSEIGGTSTARTTSPHGQIDLRHPAFRPLASDVASLEPAVVEDVTGRRASVR